MIFKNITKIIIINEYNRLLMFVISNFELAHKIVILILMNYGI